MRCCGLKVKTEERLVVPWNEGNLITQVQALLPGGSGRGAMGQKHHRAAQPGEGTDGS